VAFILISVCKHHWIAEQLLDRTPMLTKHLRPTFFAEWLDWSWATDGTSGVIRLPMGGGRHAPVAGEDQAYVIAALLENPEPHDRKVGPVEMNQDDIAEAIGRTLGIPVHVGSVVDLDEGAVGDQLG
jgi:NAD(P)H dehydrogenase (quinone)